MYAFLALAAVYRSQCLYWYTAVSNLQSGQKLNACKGHRSVLLNLHTLFQPGTVSVYAQFLADQASSV